MKIKTATGFTGEVIEYRKDWRRPGTGHAIVKNGFVPEPGGAPLYAVVRVTEDTTVFGNTLSEIESGLTFEQAHSELRWRMLPGAVQTDQKESSK